MESIKRVSADILLSGNAIFTGLEDMPTTGCIAIKGNRILAVGSYQDLENMVDVETKRYDFKDHLIVPGFHDSHIHLILAGLFQKCVNLQKAISEEEAAQMVKEYADSRPEDPWVLGFTWYHVFWKKKELPNRNSLDRLISDRPVFLLNYEGHGAWVNSKALAVCGIDRNTPNPSGGEIAKDNNGEPTGFLYENAMGLVSKFAYDIPKDMQVSILRELMLNAAKKGVTSICDMQPFIGIDMGEPQVYKDLENKGELTIRINFTPGLTENLEKVKKLRLNHHSGCVQFSGLKQFVDGVATTYTAYMIDAYSDCPDSSGSTVIPIERLKNQIIKADKEGFRIRLHACGDGAVRLALDCFEAASKLNGIRDSRHTIEHIENISSDDIGRFFELGVIASMQPEHLAMTETFADNPYPVRLGLDRIKLTWPFKSLMDAGAVVTLGTDCPVVDMDPLQGIYRAVSRVHNDGEPTGGWNPKEKISVASALLGYTQKPAYLEFRENELGTLQAGKLADIVVLDRNLFKISEQEIRDTKVKMTMMDGKIVYEG